MHANIKSSARRNVKQKRTVYPEPHAHWTAPGGDLRFRNLQPCTSLHCECGASSLRIDDMCGYIGNVLKTDAATASSTASHCQCRDCDNIIEARVAVM